MPVAVSYENVPEDREFASDSEGTHWLNFLRGRTRVHVDLCAPVRVSNHILAEEPALEIGSAIVSARDRQLRVMPDHVLAQVLRDAAPEAAARTESGPARRHVRLERPARGFNRP